MYSFESGRDVGDYFNAHGADAVAARCTPHLAVSTVSRVTIGRQGSG